MKLSKAQMQQLRQIELEILQTFICVCEKLGIQYFIVQGTLLGAVRHKGFIPWDDDIDVGMLREDYEIFLKKGQKLLPDCFFLQTHATDPSYPHGFAKIRKNNTAFVETTCKNLDMNHGIYIDVFPFDFYPDAFLERIRYEWKKMLLRYRIRSALYIPNDHHVTFSNMIRSCLKFVSKMVYPSLDNALYRQAELYKQEVRGNRRINNGSPWGKKECIPAEWLTRTVKITFEGMCVNAPAEYKKYLTHVYGDYMELPPPEKQIPHHYICALSFTNTYDYIKSHNSQQ